MSAQLFDHTPDRTGLFRHNQFRNELELDHWDLWPDILRAYRRYRKLGVRRDHANLLTFGYADGRRYGPILTTMHRAR